MSFIKDDADLVTQMCLTCKVRQERSETQLKTLLLRTGRLCGGSLKGIKVIRRSLLPLVPANTSRGVPPSTTELARRISMDSLTRRPNVYCMAIGAAKRSSIARAVSITLLGSILWFCRVVRSESNKSTMLLALRYWASHKCCR